jgi:hypothetical protein
VTKRIAAVAVLALAACGPNKVKIAAEGEKLVAQFAPQVATVVKDSDALAAKMKSLPAELPEVADLAARVTAHQGKIAALKKRVEEFPSDLAAVLEVGKESEFMPFLETFKKEAADGIAAAGPRLAELSGQLTALQAKVAAGAAPAAAQAAAK